jgi:hypothetical protein
MMGMFGYLAYSIHRGGKGNKPETFALFQSWAWQGADGIVEDVDK